MILFLCWWVVRSILLNGFQRPGEFSKLHHCQFHLRQLHFFIFCCPRCCATNLALFGPNEQISLTTHFAPVCLFLSVLWWQWWKHILTAVAAGVGMMGAAAVTFLTYQKTIQSVRFVPVCWMLVPSLFSWAVMVVVVGVRCRLTWKCFLISSKPGIISVIFFMMHSTNFPLLTDLLNEQKKVAFL